MNLIIVLVLISIVSSVFQALNQDKKKQAKEIKPLMAPSASKNINPPAMRVIKPESQNRPQKKQAVKIARDVSTEAPIVNSFDLTASPEGIQTEGLSSMMEKTLPEKPSDIEEPIAGDIGLDDLQRSIIMAEILGKPRALKGFIR